jgi:hypothetical protein
MRVKETGFGGLDCVEWLWIGFSGGCCEHGYELSAAIKAVGMF